MRHEFPRLHFPRTTLQLINDVRVRGWVSTLSGVYARKFMPISIKTLATEKPPIIRYSSLLDTPPEYPSLLTSTSSPHKLLSSQRLP
jgi:hypothetical protein